MAPVLRPSAGRGSLTDRCAEQLPLSREASTCPLLCVMGGGDSGPDSPVGDVPEGRQEPRQPGAAQEPAGGVQSRHVDRLQPEQGVDVEVNGLEVLLQKGQGSYS